MPIAICSYEWILVPIPIPTFLLTLLKWSKFSTCNWIWLWKIDRCRYWSVTLFFQLWFGKHFRHRGTLRAPQSVHHPTKAITNIASAVLGGVHILLLNLLVLPIRTQPPRRYLFGIGSLSWWWYMVGVPLYMAAPHFWTTIFGRHGKGGRNKGTAVRWIVFALSKT